MLGGLKYTRKVDFNDSFESLVFNLFSASVQELDYKASELWGALSNVSWFEVGTDNEVGYSFRAAGDLVAAIRGEGDYLDWYCSGPAGEVPDWIEVPMEAAGWKYETY